MLQYAITSRNLFHGSDRERQSALLAEAAGWIENRIDFIQLREPDLPAASQIALARNILQQIRAFASPTKLLIHSRPDVAIVAGAHGVHLTASSNELTPAQVRNLFAAAVFTAAKCPLPIVTISCHTLPEVMRACNHQVDAILFAPVFEKPLPGQPPLPGQGLDRLREACLAAAPIPVYALGGVTRENSSSCLHAGAAGVAGIRLFHG